MASGAAFAFRRLSPLGTHLLYGPIVLITVVKKKKKFFFFKKFFFSLSEGAAPLCLEPTNNLLNFHRETLVDRLVQVLQGSIFSGQYPPNTMISEGGIAKEFRVGRVPAREALLRLEEMNLIRKSNLRRTIVKLSPEEFADMHELKTAIESFGVVKGSLRATQQEIDAIQEIMNRCGAGHPARRHRPTQKSEPSIS